MPIAPVFPKGGGACPPCPPGVGSWKVLNTIDLTGLDAASIPVSATPGSTILNKGGVPFIELFWDYSGTGLVYDVNAGPAGIRGDWISGTANYLTLAFSVNNLLGLGTMDPDKWRGRYAFQMIVDNITYLNVNAERFGCYFAGDWNNMLGVANAVGNTIMDNGTGVPATGASIGFWNGTDINEYTNQPQPTSACFTIVMMNGAMTDQMIDANVGYVTPYDAPDYGPMLAHRSPNQGIPYYNSYPDAYLACISRRRTNGTITGIRVLKFE